MRRLRRMSAGIMKSRSKVLTIRHCPLHRQKTKQERKTIRRPASRVDDGSESIRRRVLFLRACQQRDDDRKCRTKINEDERLCDLCQIFRRDRIQEAVHTKKTNEQAD